MRKSLIARLASPPPNPPTPCGASDATSKTARSASVSTETIDKLAPLLKTSSQWLISGSGEEEADLQAAEAAEFLGDGTRPARRSVRIVGYVGAGSEAHYYKVADEDFEEVDAPLGASDKTVAVQIRGKSWGPLMDSWLVFYDEVHSPVTEGLINEICVVGLADESDSNQADQARTRWQLHLIVQLE